jgi:hypothetical protein
MVARIATFEGGDNDAIRRMVEENPPQQPDGISKVLVLANGNERLFITFFDSREAVAAADARFEAMGNEISEDIRGKRKSVEVYDVLFEGQP